MFDFLKRPSQDVRIDIPSVTIEFNHRTRTVFMYLDNATPPPDAFDELAEHFKRHGYLLTVFTPSPVPPARAPARKE